MKYIGKFNSIAEATSASGLYSPNISYVSGCTNPGGLVYTNIGDNLKIGFITEDNLIIPKCIIDTDTTITSNLKLHTIVVRNGATLTIDNQCYLYATNGIVIEDTAKIVIKVKSYLIAGINGIISPTVDSLVLESNIDQEFGYMMIDPECTVNNTPLGTVNWTTYAHKANDSYYFWQHFGIPTTSLPTIIKPVAISYKEWSPSQGWVYDGGSSKLTTPFIGHECTVNSTDIGNIVNFKGNLCGNQTNSSISVSPTYNLFSNSSSAPLSIKAIFDTITASTWLNEIQVANEYKWGSRFQIITREQIESGTAIIDEMPVMQAFFIGISVATAYTGFNYKTMVWDWNMKKLNLN